MLFFCSTMHDEGIYHITCKSPKKLNGEKENNKDTIYNAQLMLYVKKIDEQWNESFYECEYVYKQNQQIPEKGKTYK